MLRALAVACVAVMAADASRADCTLKTSNLDGYGVTAIGADTVANMDAHSRRLPDCDLKTDAVCVFADSNGVQYSFVEGAIEWKSATLVKLRPGYKLPAGLTAADTLSSVRNKMQRASVALEGPVPDKDHTGWAVLASDTCLLNNKAEAFSVEFTFDESGHLIKFTTRMPSVRD